MDSGGKTVNDKKTLTDFDACKEIKDNLKDGESVFIRGNLDYSSFTDDKGNKRTSTKLVPIRFLFVQKLSLTMINMKNRMTLIR